ncbi:MAG: cysteine-rich CWC family protein [Cyclobacteriaceae bacterium]
MPYPANSKCSSCHSAFHCGHASQQECWCMSLPQVLAASAGSSCLCPDCLYSRVKSLMSEKLQAEQLQLFLSRKPQPGHDYYLNENGYWVFTAWYHLKRGNCCKSGCRHCPYPESD